LGVDLAGHLHSQIVAVVAAAHRPPERIGVLLSPGLPTARPSVGPGTYALLLHRLRQPSGTLAHGIQRAPLAVDGTVGVTLAELAFGLPHGLARIAELAHFVALALLSRLAETMLAELLEQLVEPLPQALLILTQVAHLAV